MKKLLFPIIIFTAVISLYYPVLFTYFSQDDFFHFKVSQTDSSIFDFINLFGFHSFDERGIAFYRPISRELPFNLLYLIFGLSAIPFRVLSLFIHFINIYLVYILVYKLFNDKYLSFFVSFFFGITSANVATLYYLAGGIQTLLATTFTLSALLLFHLYIYTNKLKFKLLSFITFILGLSSHEQATIIPILIIGLIFVSKKIGHIRRYLLDLLPFFVTVFILIFLEIYKIGFSSSEQQYQVVFDIKRIFNSLFWYTLWAFGLPETLIDFVLPGLKLNPNLLRYWSNFYIFIFPSFLIAAISLIVFTFYVLIRNTSVFANKIFLFALLWFPIGLLPLLLLPLHKSTHYLTISLPAFWIIIGFILFNFFRQIKTKNILLTKIFISLFIISLIVLSGTSAMLGSKNYWAATRGKLAKKIINLTLSKYPSIPKGSAFYFTNDPNYPYVAKEWGGTSKQVSLILNGADALQLLYKDPTLKVYYEDLKKPDYSENNIYQLVAKWE